METPSSASKISPNSGNGGFNSSSSRIALFDISNDSPVVGLTLGTPARSSFKTSSRLEVDEISVNDDQTDGIESGEALLRRQVKSLLRSIEEEECSYDDDDDDDSFDDSTSVFPVRLLAPGNLNKEEEETVLRSPNNAAAAASTTTTTTKDLCFDFFGDKYHGAMFSDQEQISHAR